MDQISPRRATTPTISTSNRNSPRTSLSRLGYIGSQGRHLFHFRDLNQFNTVAGPHGELRQRHHPIGYGEQCFPSYSTGLVR